MNQIEIFKALADPTRLKILECIKNEEKCICEVIPYTGKSQPNVSLHLKTLKNAGLITERKDGTRIMLSIADKDVFKLIDIASKFK
jgi:DNA-binding transcriptional ArsR family regulator